MSETSYAPKHQENSVPARKTDAHSSEQPQPLATRQLVPMLTTTDPLQEPPVAQESEGLKETNQGVSLGKVDVAEFNNGEERGDARLRELEHILKELEKQNHQLRIAMKDVLDKYDQSESDNAILRSQIVSMRAPSGQVNDDGYYVQKLNWLNEAIQVWAAGVYKRQCSHGLEPEVEAEVERILGYYQPGKALLHLLREHHYTIREVYQNPTQRITLVRHLVALFLSTHVFKPFCVGMPDE